MKTDYQTLLVNLHDGVLHVQFNRDKDTNSFSRQMTLELTDVCKQVQQDGESEEPQIGVLVLTGGTNRSFSVGGDFCDVSQLDEEQEIRSYLGEIIDLYIDLLKINVPVVAAIDKYAIGQGLQVALMSDWRVGTDRCQLQMPELKNGVACPLGSGILEFLCGRAKMQQFVFDCEFISAEASRDHALLSQISSVESLQADALSMARKLQKYPRASFTTTKKIQNQRFIEAIESGREASSQAHVAAFMRKAGKQHFDKILGRAV